MKAPLRLSLLFALAAAGGVALQWLFAATLLALPVAVLLGLLLARLAARRSERLFAEMTSLVRSLREGDFSQSLGTGHIGEAGGLTAAFNLLSDTLRRERQNLHQREKLIDTMIQAAPQALVLTAPDDRIAYGNAAARQLLADGGKLEGQRWQQLLMPVPEPLREVLLSDQDKLASVHINGEPEVFQVLHRRFTLNGQPHVLHLAQRLTRELTRQEMSTWKNLIRIVSHELNNSLAPISSLAHSGRALLAQQQTVRLDEVFATIQERATRLKLFLDGYADFAKLPKPRLEWVQWGSFVHRLGHAHGFALDGPLPAEPGWFDPIQLQQVLINLLKNAHESGSAVDAVMLRIEMHGTASQLHVLDRGSGISETTLANALLPFYTTKQTGTGLGLALSREVVEAHGGRLALINREGGGLEVRIWLPGP